MPHISIKIFPGKTEEEKQLIADKIVNDFMELLGYGADPLSVSIEEVSKKEWKEKVYDAEIMAHEEKLYKKPGYVM